MPKDDNRIQVRVRPDLYAWLQGRAARLGSGGSVHLAAQQELMMWRSALDAELRRIRLTVPELNTLADLTRGTAFTPIVTPGVLALELSDAVDLAQQYPDQEEDYPAKWGADGDRLLRYLRALSPTAEHALTDSLARWHENHAELTEEGWRSVGLNPLPEKQSAK
jgi:hypothetical protein